MAHGNDPGTEEDEIKIPDAGVTPFARAAAVAAALAKDYGIAAKRLAAHGVGPLSPRKSNQNDGGRAENRRVEMVQR